MGRKAHVKKRFPHKRRQRVRNSRRLGNIDGFANGMPLVFQAHKSQGLAATYHFRVTGREQRELSVTIADKQLRIEPGLVGAADLRVTADTDT